MRCAPVDYWIWEMSINCSLAHIQHNRLFLLVIIWPGKCFFARQSPLSFSFGLHSKIGYLGNKVNFLVVTIWISRTNFFYFFRHSRLIFWFSRSASYLCYEEWITTKQWRIITNESRWFCDINEVMKSNASVIEISQQPIAICYLLSVLHQL